MSRHFAMLVPSSQARPAVPAETGESSLRAGLASRVLSGPGLWLDWLEEAGRRGLNEELLAGSVIEEAVATAPHGHQLDRVLTAKNILVCVLAGCLFPGEGYDGILRITLGMPGLDLKPGTPVPTGPVLSKGRTRLGEQVTRRAFELDAARTDVELGIGSASTRTGPRRSGSARRGRAACQSVSQLHTVLHARVHQVHPDFI